MRVAFLPSTPGVFSDDTSFSGPGRYTAADNVRFVLGRPQTIGGWNKYFGSQLNGVCRNTLSWYDNDGNLNIAFGTHTKLYVWVAGTLYDITPVGLAAGPEHGAGGPGFGSDDYGEGDFGEGGGTEYFPRTWSLALWGENLMASPRGGTLYRWDNNVANLAVVIANAPDNITAMLVTPERQVLALGTNEASGGAFNPRCVRGCELEDYDNWTPSATNNSFESILEGGDGGNIVSGRMVGPYVGIWTDAGLHSGFFVGDNLNVYRFDLIATNCGLVGPNAVVSVNQRAWWWTRDYQCFSWGANEAPVPVSCTKRDDFKDNIATGQFEKIAGTGIGQYGEIWWFYPDARDGMECSRYISLNTLVALNQPYVWSGGTLARSAAIDSGSARNPVFVSPDGYVYSHEDGQTADGGALSWSFTVSLPYLDEGGRFFRVKGIEPDMKDQVGAVSVSFTAKKYPQSTGYAKGPYSLAAGAERKHFMFEARCGDATFAGSSSPSFARFGKPILLGEATGKE